MSIRTKILIIFLGLGLTVQTVSAARTPHTDVAGEALDWLEAPACFSEIRAGEVYWAGVHYGVAMAVLFYLAPLEREGECFWLDQSVFRSTLIDCQNAPSYDCGRVPLWTPWGPAYGIIWPK